MQNLLLLLLIFVSSAIHAKDVQQNNYEYPELLVTPKASERLSREVKEEPSKSWTAHLPVQASSLVTLYAASLAMSDKSTEASADKAKEQEDASAGAGQVGMLVGGGWLTTTVIMSAIYRPYRSCAAKLPKADGKDRESVLARERAAEECLLNPARTASRINMLSSASNFVVGAYIASAAQADMTKVMGALAAIAAFTPYIFSYHWQDVAEYHEDYKRRIYGPVTELGITPIRIANKVVPGLGLSYHF